MPMTASRKMPVESKYCSVKLRQVGFLLQAFLLTLAGVIPGCGELRKLLPEVVQPPARESH
jgi:hypothetical protein